MDDEGRASLERELAVLKEKYLLCAECPPERNCCTAKGSYEIHFTEGQLLVIHAAAGSGKTLDDLVADGHAAHDERSGYYTLRDRGCPALADGGLCKLHGRKESLDMKPCLSFPLYAQRRYVRRRGEFRPTYLVLADFRCHSVEQQWPHLCEDLADLAERYRLPVMVKYAEDGHCWEVSLGEFNALYRTEKAVPGQRLGASWDGLREDQPEKAQGGSA